MHPVACLLTNEHRIPFSIEGTDDSRKQLLIAAKGILLNQGRQLCNVDTHTIFLAFCGSDAAALFFEDVTSSCLCSFARTAPHTCCASHVIPFDAAFVCYSRYVAGKTIAGLPISLIGSMLNVTNDNYLHFRCVVLHFILVPSCEANP